MRKQHQRKKRRVAPKTDAQRGYRHAIDEFVEWYCSEPRLSFNRAVVLRYRIHLESRKLAPGTVNLRLGAVRRLAYEASDCGLLSADLAAGIRRVRGVKKIGVRLGNWLLADQAMALLDVRRSRDHEGQTRSGALGYSRRVRSASARGGRVERPGSAATRRPVGDRGLDRQSFSHSNDPGAGLG